MRPWILIACACAAIMGASLPAQGASSTTVVSATVPSATEVTVTGCQSDVAGRTSFGTILPGTSSVTTSDCSVTFGSSNDASSLRVRQQDRTGNAMYAPSAGTPTAGWGTAGLVDVAAGGWVVGYGGTFHDDGSLYLVGRNGTHGAVAHLLPNGTPDPGFGAGGVAPINFGGAGSSSGETSKIFVQPDGKVIVTGKAQFAGVTRAYAARLLTNGNPDPSFGGDGITEVPGTFPNSFYPSHGILAPDGSVYLIGAESNVAVTVHIRSDGTLDPSWGTGGVQETSFTGGFTGRYGAATLDDRGRFLIAGRATQIAVLRLRADGRPDTTFGTSGTATAVIPGAAGGEAYAIGVQSSGRIVAVGEAYAADTEFGGAAWDSNGVVDTGWGNAGTILRDVGPYDSQGYGSIVTSDRVYITGLVVRDAQNWAELHVLDRSGQLDLSFAGDGMVDLGTDAYGWESMDVVEGDQGLAVMAWGSNIKVRRYDVERMPDYDDADFDWNDGTGAFGICLLSSGTATAGWPTTGACPASDGTNWRAVPKRATEATTIAATRATAGTSTASFRFGLRVPSTQKAARYVAPISFEVVAP